MKSNECDWHKSKLGYMEFHHESERREAAGEEQKKCKKCGLWYWPKEFKKGRRK